MGGIIGPQPKVSPFKLWEKAIAEVRIIFAMAKKDFFCEFARYPTWWIWFLFYPLIAVIEYVLMGKMYIGGSISAALESKTGIASYPAFVTFGMISQFLVIRPLGWLGDSLRHDMLEGTLEQNFLAPIGPVTLLFGRTIAFFLLNLIQVVFTFIPLWIILQFSIAPNLYNAALVIILGGLVAWGFSFFFAGLNLIFKDVGPALYLFTTYTVVFCGVVYPVEVLPKFLRGISWSIPFTYMIRALRGAFLLGKPMAEIKFDLAILGICVLAFIPLGFACFLWAIRRARIRGTLATY